MPTKTTGLRVLEMGILGRALRVFVLFLLVIAAACATTPSISTTTQLSTLNRLDELQTIFNQDQGKTRIILLAAPT